MIPVVILAGGLATRMRPITEKIPKAMISVNGKPFIHHQLTLLRAKGVSHIVLCVGYLGEMIEQYVGDGRGYHLDIKYSYDGDRLLGTGGAIRKIINDLPDDFFILYGDSYLDIDFRKVEQTYFSSKKRGLMAVFKNEGKWDTSNVIFQDNELVRYSKKYRTQAMSYIDYGLGILNKSVFKAFPEGVAFDLADVYEQLSDSNQLFGYEVFERFYEVGSQKGLADLANKLSQEK
jgi:NDP-sugar pyrophosphorylase family protein